jgi:hypothetical protein
MSETKRHGVEILGVDTTEKGSELLTDTSVEVLGGRVGNDGDG